MTYKILNTRTQEQMIFTEVEYNFDNQIVIVEVAHYNPVNSDEIDFNIIERAQSELNKLNMINQVSSILPLIELNVTKNINI
jgi:hypothetical protein